MVPLRMSRASRPDVDQSRLSLIKEYPMATHPGKTLVCGYARLRPTRVRKILPAVLFVMLALLLVQSGGQAQAPDDDALPFTRSYFVTGNYVVGGVDLLPASQSGGFITGTIPMSGVPANADILAAFLYWETISTPDFSISGVEFRGQPVEIEQFAALLPDPTSAPCWSSGGGAMAQYKLTMHRADVRRLLPVQLDAQGNKTGKRLVNDTDLTAAGFGGHTVKLPEAGTGNQLPSSAGASLLVIYRDVRDDVDPITAGLQPPPLTSILLYDGVHIQAQGASTNQMIRGFMQSSANPVFKMTHIAGGGAKNSTERVWFGPNRDVAKRHRDESVLHPRRTRPRIADGPIQLLTA